MYRKEIVYDRETHDYAMYLDGELVGFARTYHEAEVTLELKLPTGVQASVPWPTDGAPGRHRLPHTAFTWASQVVLGEFDALHFTAAGCEFDVAVMKLPREISDAGIQRWLGTAAKTVASLYGGQFPVPHMQVIVVPYRGGGDPAYFGMALRGGMVIANPIPQEYAMPRDAIDAAVANMAANTARPAVAPAACPARLAALPQRDRSPGRSRAHARPRHRDAARGRLPEVLSAPGIPHPLGRPPRDGHAPRAERRPGRRAPLLCRGQGGR